MVNIGKLSMRKRRALQKRRICRFCADASLVIDYKDTKLLSQFTTERGKIIPRRISGNCSKHQRELTLAVKRARHIALLPYTSSTLSG